MRPMLLYLVGSILNHRKVENSGRLPNSSIFQFARLKLRKISKLVHLLHTFRPYTCIPKQHDKTNVSKGIKTQAIFKLNSGKMNDFIVFYFFKHRKNLHF